MAKQTNSKCKLCRRAGEKLFLKGDRCATPKCAIVRKPYAPGMHGGTNRSFGGGGGHGRGGRGLSEFGKQLAEKQKIKRMYGVSEQQFKKHLSEAMQQKGVVSDNLLIRLESRFDNIIYRLGLASSRSQARQMVNHSTFLVNGKILDVPSAKLKTGDEISVKKQKAAKLYIKELEAILRKKDEEVSSWLSFDSKTMTGKVLSSPPKDEINSNLNTHLVIEFYSR
ncbi:MAG: 30S ribosomal protein S4 [Patescibacteria group bacterium]|nr:30S ribosomal protein S4 [Patescibacteria group bacterium]